MMRYLLVVLSASFLVLTSYVAEARMLAATTLSAEDQDELAKFSNEVKNGKYKKIGGALGEMYADFMKRSNSATAPEDLTEFAPNAAHTMDDNKLMVEVVGTTDETGVLRRELEKVGFVVTGCTKHLCSGYMPIDNLLAFNDLDIVNFVRPSLSVNQMGSAENEASQSMSIDLAREEFGVDGTGTIGVLSDSFNALNEYDDDISSGDLPEGVNVLKDAHGTDEGRAMLQLIHDIAPGANLAFHTAIGGEVAFAQGIRDLADLCDVIVDDVKYFAEPMFQDGIIAQAVDDVVRQGIPYFSSAGNYRRNSWEGAFVDTGITDGAGRPLHDFGGGDTRQTITVGDTASVYLIFNWDEPYSSVNAGVGSSSDLDMKFYAPGAETPSFTLSDNNIGGDPIEIASGFSGLPAYEIEIVLVAGNAPALMKWVILRGNKITIEFDSNSGTNYGHSNAALAAGVGAARFDRTPGYGVSPAQQESFSSAGEVPILFDLAGNRLLQPEVRMQPRFVGTDGVSTAMARFNPFFGTSAAAPNVAAIAILMQEASDGNLTPEQIYSILEDTAEDMDDRYVGGPDIGFDFGTGFGFVKALPAVTEAFTKATVMTPSPIKSPVASPVGSPPVASPVASPVGSPPSSPPSPFCFSRANTVLVQSKGLVQMDSLQIGDYVLARNTEFSRVISFIHLKRGIQVDYLQIHAVGLKNPLEITSSHMLFVNNHNFPVQASEVKVGDMLGENRVSKVKSVKRSGVYAPVTESGDIVVSGVRASSYAAVLTHVPIHQHAGAHAFFAARRLFCRFNFANCESETYTGEGFPEWLSPIIHFALRIEQSPLAQTLLCLVLLPFIAAVYILERMLLAPFLVGALVFVLLYVSKKIKASSNEKHFDISATIGYLGISCCFT